jgi:protein involved in polysaccharide export with SLBB domain
LAVLASALSGAAQTGGISGSGNSSNSDCFGLNSTSGSCGSQQGSQNIGDQSASPSVSQQQRNPDNTQVYIDSAGNVQQRTNSTNDRNMATFFPPDPVSDFQKLARSSTGEILPVFSRDLFQRSPSTFAPADQIPVTADYVIGPGDEVLVRLWGAEQVNGNSQLTVDASGNIYVPRVGTVHVAGLRMDQLQNQVTAEVNHVFHNYRLSVSLGHLRSIQIFVVGQARRPGAYTISALSTVLNALFASGGPSIAGSMRHIQVRRGNQMISELDLYDLVLHGDKSHDIRLESGDVLFIPAVGPQVALAGSVRVPAVYELKEGDAGKAGNSLEDLITLAGGFSATAATQQIRLERLGNDFQRHAVTMAVNAEGRAILLHDGDILYANHIGFGFDKSITIRGNLANPGRFAWKPGMRLSDILPDRAALLTGDYWRERNRMGVPTPMFEPYEYNTRPPAAGGVGVDSMLYRSGQSPTKGGSSRDGLSAVEPPHIEGTESQQSLLAASGVVSSSALSLDQQAANSATTNNTTTSSGQTSRNLELFQQLGQGQDQQTNQNPQYTQGTQPSTAAFGMQNRNSTAISSKQPERMVIATTESNGIRIPAPEIDWSYAVIERLDPKTLKNSLIPFNLGKLVLDHDTSQDLVLQSGDVVTILNQRDVLVPQTEQTKYVRLEGEFPGAGVYSAEPGETLDHLVKRAGGFTSDAYLYGSSFLRESARALQQQRLDEYITRLSTDMDRQTAVTGASTSSGVSDPNALALERNLVTQLRTLRATGRVVLEFMPNSTGVASIPQIALENGDIFRVPSRPNIVNVLGAVYGQNVFLYNPHRHLSDYMSLAGRPNRIADKDRSFIIRADGSIFSRERAKGVLSNHFDASAIYPGDSIVVPEKLIKPTLTRQLLDYSQILSSFGLAAAAITVIGH